MEDGMITEFHGPQKAMCDICGELRLRSFMIQRVGCGCWYCLTHESEPPRKDCPSCQMKRIREERQIRDVAAAVDDDGDFSTTPHDE
jgi:hypothetical protein